jgi:hypothetical protein
LRHNRDHAKIELEGFFDVDGVKIPPPVPSDTSFAVRPSIAARSRLASSKMIDTTIGKPYRLLTRRRVRHPVLNSHLTIAWDLDGTLINGSRSWFWRRWIRDNYMRHKFWIVTFRGSRDANRIWNDLECCSDPLDPTWFEGIRVVEGVLWHAWVTLPTALQDLDHEAKLTEDLAQLVATSKLDLSSIIEINRAIRAWKAVECKKLRATVLVEDREAFCKPYCDAMGITFVNAIAG